MSKEDKLKYNVGLKSCDKCEYYLRCEECVGSHYREEIPKLNKRIAELEEQLANSIRLKFEIGQKVWFVNEVSEEIYLGIVVGFEVSKVYFRPLDTYYRIEYQDSCSITEDFEDGLVFATKEEALKKLEELKGE